MIPRGWKIERQADVLKTIHITAPNGYVASVNAIDRNPANVLYMLADALLKGTDAEIYKGIAENYARGGTRVPVLSGVVYVCRNHDAACVEVPAGLRCANCPAGVRVPVGGQP